MKFRVRCNETNELYDVEDCWVDGRGNIMDCNGDMFGDGEVTIELFTGQEDRNGVEIYEGDTVKDTLRGKLGVVKYMNSSFKIYTSGFGVLLMGKYCEVIQ